MHPRTQNPEQNLSFQAAKDLKKSQKNSFEAIDFDNNSPKPIPPLESVKDSAQPTIVDNREQSSEPELFADDWLNEEIPSATAKPIASAESSLPNSAISASSGNDLDKIDSSDINEAKTQVAELKSQKAALELEIVALKEEKAKLLAEKLGDVQKSLEFMVKEGAKELEERKAALQTSIEQLERRRERIREEMRTTFAGASQDLAIRVQGFKDYLVGSLQDLAASAEQLELIKAESWEKSPEIIADRNPVDRGAKLEFVEGKFQQQTREIKNILDRYRTRPNYYGEPWQLRRTFEPIHSERVQEWFFSQGGRGTIKSMGSRLQNILIASAVISVLHYLHDDRRQSDRMPQVSLCRTLVLANTPERLGEWRRGLQDCLGISRGDFGPNRGVVLFESAEALVQKAERLVDEKQIPLVIIDETEDLISLSLLQFPLWLAFAPEPQQMSSGYMY
jgi:hypothetical protein